MARVQAFGRRDVGPSDARVRPGQPARAFGKRGTAPPDGIAPRLAPAPELVPFLLVAKVRLSGVCRDLSALYDDPAYPDETPLFRIVHEPELMLKIGEHASVRIDQQRGVYVFSVMGRQSGAVTVETANDDLLLDHIVCHLALDRARYLSVAGHGRVAGLVGMSMAEVERSMIFATLRQCQFNRTRAAQMLGISVRTIRNKLRAYRTGDDTAASSAILEG